MRFLQIEWHNHERSRNAWDIERAEMKARIAKQEGDYRSAKKLNESLDRRIRMLERALKQERAKNRAMPADEKPPTEEEAKKDMKAPIKRTSPLLGKDWYMYTLLTITSATEIAYTHNHRGSTRGAKLGTRFEKRWHKGVLPKECGGVDVPGRAI